jgi:hypothetical protein
LSEDAGSSRETASHFVVPAKAGIHAFWFYSQWFEAKVKMGPDFRRDDEWRSLIAPSSLASVNPDRI